MDYTPHTPYAEPQLQTPATRPSRAASWIKVGGFLLAVLICATAAYWIAQKFPDKVQSVIITVDRFGITEVAAQEQRRIRTINRLPITFEEKQVLIKRTVFLNATREMVYLALGNPVCVLQSPATHTTSATEHWVYYIKGDSKPTRLDFQNNELVSASKASALDTCK